LHIIAEITYKCPANCPFCPIKKLVVDKMCMDLSEFKSALKLFTTLPHSRRLLTISGGEPTLIKGLHRFVKVAHEYGFTVTVATNCYNPERLLEAKPDFVQISLDSINSNHNMSRKLELWHKVLEVLKYVKEGKLNGFIRYTLMKDNICELYQLKTRLNALGLDVKIYAMPIRGCPELAPSKEDILKVIKDKVAVLPSRCPAGKGQFVLTPDMKVLDCIFHRQVLGKLERFDEDELLAIVENGKKLKPYPCGEPYWWSKCQSVQSAERN